MTDPSSAPVVGRMFGRYRVDALLGAGGMGQVFRAFDTVISRPVALKVLAPPPAEPVSGDGLTTGRTRAIERLMREARAAAALSHPNVVAVYDVGSHDGVHYLALELIEGQTLRAIATEGTATLQQKQAWLVELARALAAAHHAGLVHRDIKPENVMIRSDGTLKVLDFGLARAEREAADPASPSPASPAALPTLTAEGVVIGTPLYMSPEQLFAHRADGRADQWAWGVLAWELLSGALPWAHTSTPIGLVAHILTQDPGSLRSHVPALSETWDRVVRRALSKERDDRFASMHDLLAALEAPDDAPVAVAPAPSTPAHAAQSAPARAASRDARSPGATASHAPAKRRSRVPLVIGVLVGLTTCAGGIGVGVHRWASGLGGGPAMTTASTGETTDHVASDRPSPATPSAIGPVVAAPCSGSGCAVAQIAIGGDTTCARLASGAVYCWGRNITGTLGGGSGESQSRPVRLEGLDATRVSIGYDHACAITRDGRLLCWGENRFGIVGTGVPNDEIAPRPVPVALPEPTIDVATGRFHTCALGVSRTVRCWGANEHMELGDPSRGDSDVEPAAVPGTAGAIAIDATEHFTCALRDLGAERVVTCWGSDDQAQLGARAASPEGSGRAAIDALRGPDVAQVAAGASHTCARRTTGSVECWGAAISGETGDPDLAHPTLVPRHIEGLGVATHVDTGDGFACALLAGGAIRCWGSNAGDASQLGAGSDVESSAVPLRVRGVADAAVLGVGSQHACAATSAHEVRCWGANGHGQLGAGTITAAEPAPIAVVGLPR